MNNPLFGARVTGKPSKDAVAYNDFLKSKEAFEALGGVIQEDDEAVRWRMNQQLHREDGPAEIFKDGTQKWFQNGVLHREDGPAFVCQVVIGPRAGQPSVSEWYENGKRHRVGAPAIIRYDASAIEFYGAESEWFVHGKKVSERESHL